MSRIFTRTPVQKPKKNVFPLRNSVRLSCNMGQLVPIMCKEVVPGDKFSGATNILTRLAPMLAPMMHSVNVFTHFFFVPNRIVWNEFEDFITGGKDGTLQPVFPRFGWTQIDWNLSPDNVVKPYLGPGSLVDYMGAKIDTSLSAGSSGSGSSIGDLSQIPFRAYQMIYNEYYRDQNLSDEVVIDKGSGISTADAVINEGLLTLRNRCWEKDYFTSALPWAQRGAPVTIPLTTGLKSDVRLKTGSDLTTEQLVKDPSGRVILPTASIGTRAGNAGFLVSDPDGPNEVGAYIDPNGTLEVDLDETGILVNDFRRSIRLQEWLEKNARGGARYIEQILSHFGVASSDARLQRPEFLGGGKSPIMISEVLQTSETDSTPQANMAGHGISAHGSHTWSKFIEEHGYIIGIMSIMPRTAYQQGIPRHFNKYDKFDFFWPEFAHIGEQEIWNQELYYNPLLPNERYNAFGYTPRYAEYKTCMSEAAGDMRTSLNFWGMQRIFSSPPALNESFVNADPTQRIFAVTDDSHKCWCLVANSVKAVRPMPKFGVPTI